MGIMCAVFCAAGIKVALPAESASGRCFLQLYIETILALQVTLLLLAFSDDVCPHTAPRCQHSFDLCNIRMLSCLQAGCMCAYAGKANH
jgi:hypothetical protein